MKSSLAHHGDQRSSWQCSAEDQRFNWRRLPSFTQSPSQEFTAKQTASFESFKHNDDDRSWKERRGPNGCLIFPSYLLFSFFVSRIYGLWLRFPPFLFIFDRQKDNGTCTIMSGIEGVLWYFDTSLIRLQRTRIVENSQRSQTDTDLFLNVWCTMRWFIRTSNMKTYVRVLPKLPYDCDPPIPPHPDQGIEPIGSGVCLIVFDVEGQVRTDRSLTLELNF